MSDDKNINKVQDTLLEFPCEFHVKAIGLAENSFDLLVAELVSNHVENVLESAIESRESSNGKYLSVTITITATSKPQLDAIYQDLSDHKLVVMAL